MDKHNVKKQLGCVLLAAGNGTRFGGNKLIATLDGKTLITRALDVIPAEQFAQTVVVTQYPDIASAAKEYGFTVLINASPELGQSRSVKLGLSSLRQLDAVMFLVADQPLLKRESILSMLDCFAHQDDCIVALAHNGTRGNPCIFPAAFYGDLMALEGDHGGNQVIRQHEDRLVLCEVPAQELSDVDTPALLEALQK